MANTSKGGKTFAEYFAGIGLMRLGLEETGWSINYANDIDSDKRDMYRHHFEDADEHFALGDIHSLAAAEIPESHLATASFPCNDLSLAGMRSGLGGKQSSAFWGFIRILKEMGERRPPLVLLENVAGFLTSHGGEDIRVALSALNQLGYGVDVLILDAERFVPQSRVRLFVVGSRLESKGSLEIAEPTAFYESAVRPKAVAQFIFDHPEIDWKLRNLPNPPKREKTLADIVEDLPDESDFWWSEERANYLISQMSSKHSAILEAMRCAPSWSYGTVFRRVRNKRSMAELRIDGIAGCLRTPRGGSGRQILLQAGYGKVKVRLLTPRECARLMGADDFQINTSLNKALFGFGDAVCVPVITWLARNYLDPLLEEIMENESSVHRVKISA
jgi:DNA (cytosine-5)-methyltransferase 1